MQGLSANSIKVERHWLRRNLVVHEEAAGGERGFDIVGDLHGCLEELLALMTALGYHPTRRQGRLTVQAPLGRRMVFVGDLVTRGPRSVETLELVMGMVASGEALCVAGNQDMKLLAVLKKGKVTENPGVARTILQLARRPLAFQRKVIDFLEELPATLRLDSGRLLVAHTGLREDLQGARSAEARRVAIFGEVLEELDKWGAPKRVDWASEYRGEAWVVFGHTPQPAPVWRNRTVNIDTGCVYGGRLTALLYPEMETMSVAATACHWSRRPVAGKKAVAKKTATVGKKRALRKLK